MTETAAVTGAGQLEGGSATAASRTDTGAYTVTFSHDISDCVAVATPGAWNGGSFRNDANGTVSVGTSDSIFVRFNDNSVTRVDTDFMVILVCTPPPA